MEGGQGGWDGYGNTKHGYGRGSKGNIFIQQIETARRMKDSEQGVFESSKPPLS